MYFSNEISGRIDVVLEELFLGQRGGIPGVGINHEVDEISRINNDCCIFSVNFRIVYKRDQSSPYVGIVDMTDLKWCLQFFLAE